MYGVKATSALFNTVARQGVLAKQLTAPKSTAFLSQLPARQVSGKISYTTTTRSTQFSQKPIQQQQQQETKEQATEDASANSRNGPWLGAKALLDPAQVDSCVLQAAQSKDPQTIIAAFVKRKDTDTKISDSLSSKTYEAVIDAYSRIRRNNQPLKPMLEAYQEMIESGAHPTSQTYALLIRSLCDRSIEVQRTLIGLRRQVARTGTTIDLLDALEDEANLEQALHIFRKAVKESRTEDFDLELYNRMIQSLSQEGNTECGIYVLSQLEKSNNVKPDGVTFTNLITMFGAAGDLHAVKECFMEYSSLKSILPFHNPEYVYNALVTAHVNAGDLKGALNIVQYIMIRDKIKVSILPYNKILRRACYSGNMELVEPLLSQLESDPKLPNPDATTYSAVLAGYIRANDLENASRIYQQLITKDISKEYGHLSDYAHACYKNGQLETVIETLEDMLRGGLRLDVELCEKVLDRYVSSGRNKKAIESLDSIMRLYAKKRYIDIKFQLTTFAMNLLTKFDNFEESMSVLEILKRYSIPLSRNMSDLVLTKYSEAKKQPEIWEELNTKLNVGTYGLLYDALFRRHCKPEEFCQSALELVEDMKAVNLPIHSSLYIRVLARIKKYKLPAEYESAWIDGCGQLLDNEIHSKQFATEDSAKEGSEVQAVNRVSQNADLLTGTALSAMLEGKYKDALDILKIDIIKPGSIPTADAVRDMIQVCTKAKRMDLVMDIYNSVIEPLGRLEKFSKQRALTTIYNAMIVSNARLEGYEAARKYYDEMKLIGASPSGDAYGALLQAFPQESPEDCSKAEKIYKEVKKNNVPPTVFLYNVMMSKFAKANRFEKILDLLDDMKQAGLTPNSVTYSTVISGALRCGNEDKALEYYRIMTASKRYQPRPGPYASLIQYYAQTKPDKSKVLYFYEISKSYKLELPVHTMEMIESMQ
ncbi:hypothetical protein BY458DRAFT_529972 [Sporodiniella umbellata]|nr:hypothetical protein BY458DRAFT_529972 [Sporodiniella umbellata]